MTSLSRTNYIVDLVANYCQATDDFFNKLSNVLKNFFTFGQCSGNQIQNLQNQTIRHLTQWRSCDLSNW